LKRDREHRAFLDIESGLPGVSCCGTKGADEAHLYRGGLHQYCSDRVESRVKIPFPD